jgi:hypothetical protein
MPAKNIVKLFIPVLVLTIFICTSSSAQLKYPAARKEAFGTMIYGRKLSDEYFPRPGSCLHEPFLFNFEPG